MKPRFCICLLLLFTIIKSSNAEKGTVPPDITSRNQHEHTSYEEMKSQSISGLQDTGQTTGQFATYYGFVTTEKEILEKGNTNQKVTTIATANGIVNIPSTKVPTSASVSTQNTAAIIPTQVARNTTDIKSNDKPTVAIANDDDDADMKPTDFPTVATAYDEIRKAADMASTDKPTVATSDDKTLKSADMESTDKPTVSTAYDDIGKSTTIESTFKPIDKSSVENAKSDFTVKSTDEPTVTSYSEIRNTEAMTFFTTKQSPSGVVMTDLCEKYGSCPPEHKVDSWYCRCDDLCQVYNDCCMDYQATTYLPRQDIYKCLRRDQEPNNYIGVFAIGVCPKEFENTSVINSCTNADTISSPPVFDRTDASRLFANKFCAFCNEVEDVTPVAIQIYDLPYTIVKSDELTSLETISSVMNKYWRTKYRLILKSPNKYRPCVNRVETSQNQKCQKYTNPLFLDQGGPTLVYRNFFCANESVRMNLKPSQSEYSRCFANNRFFLSGSWTIKTLSVIFNFGQKKNPDDDHTLCMIWRKEVDDVCSHLPTYVNVREHLELVLLTPSNQTDDFLRKIGLIATWARIVPEVTELTYMAVISRSENGRMVKVSTNVIIRKRCFAEELHTILTHIREGPLTISINSGNKETVMTRLNHSIGYNFTNLDSFRMYFPIETYFQDIKITTKQKKSLCQNVTISVERTNGGLEISGFDCGQVDMTTDRTPISVHAIATYACFSLSIVALVPLIIINRQTDGIMTVQRSNLENIAVSLILVNSLFMVGVGWKGMPIVCYFIGIGLHYLFLAFFIFMTIGVFTASLAVNRIREKRNDPPSQLKRKRLLLTLLGASLPLIVVGASFTMDRIGPPGWSPGYADNPACFPTRYPGNIAFFSGPMMLLVTVDIICIIKIIVQVEGTKKETRKLLKASTMFNDLKIYLRLVVLGGALWVIGIVAAFLGWDWLDFAFVLSCGLQGFFISVASLTTQENKRKIKTMFRRTE